ncbi:Trypsin [Rubripirellula obstinata]|uniref:Trypsin n=1 Tax=Rubripirellula obstinata TaxID=406547 RepID=A0A5B1CRD6_9BACT|nr:trypsin-like serine protease [Rubripirellula obstinata]KAA1262429.1 Trypsin [Rubripirellula obstinata]
MIRPKSPFCLLLATIIFLSLQSSSFADIQINGFTSNTNDRFTNHPSFIAGGFDLSGVGHSDGTGNTRGWGTLISPNVVLTARHFAPTELYFYPNNDTSETPQVRSVIGTQNVGDTPGSSIQTDLTLLRLNANLPSNFQTYEIADEFLFTPSGTPSGTVTTAGSFQNVNAYMSGFSRNRPVGNKAAQAWGRNRISGFVDNVDFQNNTNSDMLFLQYDSTAGGFESHARGGDSGAPLFIDDGGELLLLGVNSALFLDIVEDEDGNEISRTVQGTGVSYVGNHAAEIRSFIVTNAVPEPGTAILLCMGVVGSLLKRRR